MTVAVTQERVTKVYGWLLELARRGAPSPTNYEIAKSCLKMGTQRFQPYDRVQGFSNRKPEHGAVMIRALEEAGLVAVERGRNWRRITILQTGQVLEPKVRVNLAGRNKFVFVIDRAFDDAA